MLNRTADTALTQKKKQFVVYTVLPGYKFSKKKSTNNTKSSTPFIGDVFATAGLEIFLLLAVFIRLPEDFQS